MITEDEIRNAFTYHPPTDAQKIRYDNIRVAARTLALAIIYNTPSSADQSAAIRKLRECVMTANASIALE
jgi:hypothetical protein